jgi:hypothetical protein
MALASAFDQHAADAGLPDHGGIVGEEERAAPVVEEPFHGLPLLQDPVGEPVGLQVIRLAEIHGHEELLRAGGGGEGEPDQDPQQDRRPPTT